MTSNSLYLAHSSDPKHIGTIKDPTAIARLEFEENEKPASIEVYALVADNVISELRFVSKASIPVTACLSYLCTELNKKSVSTAFEWTDSRVIAALALPVHFHYCARKSLEAIHKTLRQSDDPFDRAFKSLSAYNGPFEKNQPFAFED